MSDKQTNKPTNDFSHEMEFSTGRKSKAYHQNYTIFFVTTILAFVLAITASLTFINKQSQQVEALIQGQVFPLQNQLSQQSHILQSTKLIDDILQNIEASRLTELQQKLTIASKKLSLLDSPEREFYQQWFLIQNQADNVITKIISNQAANEQLKNNTLIQLDTLLDAIEIEIKKQEYQASFVKLLASLQSELTSIVTMLQQLSLQSSEADLLSISTQVDKIFEMDYGKLLAVHQDDSRALVELVKDFIRFEDLVLKRGLLIKWQSQLRLMSGYQQQLFDDQQKLNTILNTLANSSQKRVANIDSSVIDINFQIAQREVPLWLWASLLISLFTIIVSLFLLRLRLKVTSEFGLEYLGQAIEGADTSLIVRDDNALVAQQSKAFFCNESYQLLQKIHQVNESNYSEADYLAMQEENKALAEEVEKGLDEKNKLKLELELIEFNASSKSKSQLVLEQQRCKELYITALRQLVYIGSCAINNIVKPKVNNELPLNSNALHHAYAQGRDLVRKLRQASCYRYLQSNKAVLTLSDVNLPAQVQAILYNLEAKFSRFENSVSLTVDKKIFAQVNLDAELFTELYRIFIRLMLTKKTKTHLALKMQLADKNSGQQKVTFTGEIHSDKKLKQLPQELKTFNEASQDHSELGEYFQTLIQYQHGESVVANLTEQGYQLSFTIPLAVANKSEKLAYPELSLPLDISKEKQALTNLAEKYIKMPVEVLLGVQSPVNYQYLAQQLKSLGLQVTFATNEPMLEKYWHSGRFSLLLTELPCSPFSPFLIDEVAQNNTELSLPRGVLSLTKSLSFESENVEYSSWLTGELLPDTSVDKLITTIAPWISEQKNHLEDNSQAKSIINNSKENSDEHAENLSYSFSTLDKSAIFDFNRYLKHQGSAELALYMLDEYTKENTAIIESFSLAFAKNDIEKAVENINHLTTNAKILAADELLSLCGKWQKVLDDKCLDSSDKSQVNLLSTTRQAIEEISLHALAIA